MLENATNSLNRQVKTKLTMYAVGCCLNNRSEMIDNFECPSNTTKVYENNLTKKKR